MLRPEELAEIKEFKESGSERETSLPLAPSLVGKMDVVLALKESLCLPFPGE